MAASQKIQARAGAAPTLDYDAIIIGAGMSGMYQLYRLRELGMRVRVFEAGTGVGGTWYWNRYPGARCDSESHAYRYFFSRELNDEWESSERYPGPPEIRAYLQQARKHAGMTRPRQRTADDVITKVRTTPSRKGRPARPIRF